jgi:sulfite exporter TauE/SafE
MNIGGTTTTAIIRGLYNAIGSGAGSAFLVWTQTNDHKTIAVAFVGAFLIALGFRGGVEGRSIPPVRTPMTSSRPT